MKTTFLKLGLLFLMSFAVATFISCDSDLETFDVTPSELVSEIKAGDIIALYGSTDEVVSVGFRQLLSTLTGIIPDIYVETPFLNNGFALQLPSLSDNLMLPPDIFMIPLTIRGNRNIRWRLHNGIHAFDINRNHEVGIFHYEVLDNENDIRITTMWVYADGDAIVTGDYTRCHQWVGCHRIIADVNVRKGWNIVYGISKEIDEIPTTITTSQRPPGNFVWTYTSFNR
jgi:hypothetical protein